MNFQKIISLVLLLFICCTISIGQIRYKIELLNDKDLYQVSLKSEMDFAYPNNIIGTAQVSIKAPVLGFELGELTNLMDNIQWEHNSTIIAPEEAKEAQYFSFGLAGSVELPLKAGVEIPLFTFKNTVGTCSGKVYLVDNQTDDFLPPNSKKANIGNQITTLASSRSSDANAYIGNVAGGIADCSLSTSLANEAIADDLSFEISPNPTKDWLNVKIQTTNVMKGNLYLQIRQVDGRKIQEQIISTSSQNELTTQLDIAHLAGGTYLIRLILDNKIFTEKFIKIES